MEDAFDDAEDGNRKSADLRTQFAYVRVVVFIGLSAQLAHTGVEVGVK